MDDFQRPSNEIVIAHEIGREPVHGDLSFGLYLDGHVDAVKPTDAM